METETEGNKESWTEDRIKALAALANTRGGKEQEAISNQIINSLHVHPASILVGHRDD